MAATGLAPCYLCGTPTSQRCASCSGVGLTTAFCSREHQKKAWPSHKACCGAGAISFDWPAVSAEELAYLNSIAYLDCPIEGGTLAGVVGEPVEEILACLRTRPAYFVPPLYYIVLASCRSAETARWLSQVQPLPDKPFCTVPLLSAQNWASHIYPMLLKMSSGVWSGDVAKKPWWSPLHRHLVQLAIVHHAMIDSSDGTEEERMLKLWYVEMVDELRGFLAGPALRFSPEEVMEATGAFLPAK
ncbi:hypothetical protein JCM10213_007965 [Rhodosporidiobolus nylandii]